MKKLILLMCLLGMNFSGFAQAEYHPTKENIKAREWFGNAKFGLFIHWGVYSILGDGEWVMQNQNISIENYEKLPSFFNPTGFDAENWVLMAKNTGMKYITITSRHHDGFSMFNTKATDYNIVQKTPYKRDVLKELAAACKKYDIKLFFYYSLLDWHNDDYFPRGNTGNKIAGRKEGKWENYIAFMKTQLTELLTNYGEIAGIWFDGEWDKKDADWHLDEIYQLIHKLQPQCLVGNNHHGAVKPGEDFQMFEKDLPGKNTTGFGTSTFNIGKLPKEVCETINRSWGFNIQDNKHKSKKELIHYLVKAAGFGSNLLLNVGPMPNGKIQPEHIESLAEVGNWLKTNGETIYETEEGIIAPSEDMVSTQKDKKLYLHLLTDNKNVFFVPNFNTAIKSVVLFKNKKKVQFKKDSYGLTLKISETDLDSMDTIVEINLK